MMWLSPWEPVLPFIILVILMIIVIIVITFQQPIIAANNRALIFHKETITLDHHEQISPHSAVLPAEQINLFMEYYLTKNEFRQKEIDFVLITNLQQKNLDHLYIIVHNKAEEAKVNSLSSILRESHTTPNIILISNPRPTYGELFRIINQYAREDDINILANSDIAFDETIAAVKRLRSNEAVALSRYNLQEYTLPLRGELESETKWTQDVWIIRGKAPGILEKVDFTTGILRCDNRIAHILVEAGYKVFNPCHNICIYHAHKSAIRNYTQDDILPGKGAFVPGCHWL